MSFNEKFTDNAQWMKSEDHFTIAHLEPSAKNV